jgi:hypothetical protein
VGKIKTLILWSTTFFFRESSRWCDIVEKYN